MKTFLDCIPCFLGQALRAGRMSTDDDALLKKLMDRLGARMSEIALDCTPPEIAVMVYDEVRAVTGVDDPFAALKRHHVEEALRLYPALKRMVEQSDDPLMTAIRVAIAGNVIDCGAGRAFDIERDLSSVLRQEFAICHFESFRRSLEEAEGILYIGDNAGESVFDRVLIETMMKPVTFAVRDRPVINDVTLADATASGLDAVSTIISTGSPAPGAVLSLCSSDFVHQFSRADMVVSKGQGNYEALSEASRPVFFLLRAKCPVIARDLSVGEGDIVLKCSTTPEE